MDELRVLIIADDPLVRGGLAALLHEDCAIVGQIALDAALLPLYSLDVYLWDLGWDPEEVPETVDLLAESGTPAVALLPDDSLAAALWAAGVQGILLRNAGLQQLLAALRAVTNGLVVLDPAWAAAPALPPAAINASDLTAREHEVLRLLADGSTNRTIAQQLQISEHTVKFHINAILSKLHAQSRTEAVVQAIKLGLITL